MDILVLARNFNIFMLKHVIGIGNFYLFYLIEETVEQVCS